MFTVAEKAKDVVKGWLSGINRAIQAATARTFIAHSPAIEEGNPQGHGSTGCRKKSLFVKSTRLFNRAVSPPRGYEGPLPVAVRCGEKLTFSPQCFRG
jgi:hypothetical protein